MRVLAAAFLVLIAVFSAAALVPVTDRVVVTRSGDCVSVTVVFARQSPASLVEFMLEKRVLEGIVGNVSRLAHLIAEMGVGGVEEVLVYPARGGIRAAGLGNVYYVYSIEVVSKECRGQAEEDVRPILRMAGNAGRESVF